MAGENFARNHRDDRILYRLFEDAGIVTEAVTICKLVDLQQLRLYTMVFKFLLTGLLNQKVRIASFTAIGWDSKLNLS